MESWAEYLALPVAPLVLAVAFAALFIPHRGVRLTIQIVAATAVAAMFVFVGFLLPLSDDAGANIGAGVLGLELAAAIAIVVFSRKEKLAITPTLPAGHERRPRRPVTWSQAALWGSAASIFIHPYALPVPLLATTIAWSREPPTKMRLIATAATAVAVAFAVGYFLYG
jgi:hypothetical protein